MLKHDRIPRVVDRRPLVGQMPRQRLTRRSLKGNAVAQTCLFGEALEQRGHATHSVAVQVRHAVFAVSHHVRQRAEGKAVADEQD